MQNWRPFPLDVYIDENTSDKFILPTTRDFQLMRETVRRLEREISNTNKDEEDKLKVLNKSLNQAQQHINETEKMVDELRPKAVRRDFAVREPSFFEYTQAEERAKDFVTGTPFVDQARLASLLMESCVSLDGKPLGAAGVQELPHSEGNRLYEEICILSFPNNDRLPFLK